MAEVFLCQWNSKEKKEKVNAQRGSHNKSTKTLAMQFILLMGLVSAFPGVRAPTGIGLPG
jgi:hypothetical protein